MAGILEFGTARATPGEKAWGQLRISEGSKEISIPVCAIHGAKKGEHAVIMANQHGREVNGIEAVRRFCEEVDPRQVNGTLLALPILNPMAAIIQEQVWTEGDAVTMDHAYRNPYNMNWNWPGREGGLLVERVAFEVWNRAIRGPERKAGLVIDLHTHAHASAVYAEDRLGVNLALLSGLRHVYLTGGSGDIPTLQSACQKTGILHLTAELHRTGVFNRQSIEEGGIVIRNLLKFLRILPGELELPEWITILDPWGLDKPGSFEGPTYLVIQSEHDGILVPHKSNMEPVGKGDLICEVLDPYSAQVTQRVLAPASGHLYRVVDYEVSVKRGGEVCVISFLGKTIHPATALKGFNIESLKKSIEASMES